MPLKLQWLVEDQVFLRVAEGEVTVDEYYEHDARLINNYLEPSPATRVHGIFDLTGLDQMPELKVLRQAKAIKHSKTGWVVLVGVDNPVIKLVASVMGQMYQARFRFYNTIEEALDFLQSMDDTLPDLHPLYKEVASR